MRGLTLTSQVSKVMTGIIQQRNAACGLSDEPFGFRAGRGIDAPVLLVKKAIQDAVRKGEQRFLLFIDLHKAYDYLDRDRTWVFLRKYGMGEHTVRILQSLYEDELLLDVGDGGGGRFISFSRTPQKKPRGTHDTSFSSCHHWHGRHSLLNSNIYLQKI